MNIRIGKKNCRSIVVGHRRYIDSEDLLEALDSVVDIVQKGGALSMPSLSAVQGLVDGVRLAVQR